MVNSFSTNILNSILLTLLSPVLALINLFRISNERLLLWSGIILFGVLGSVYVYIPGTDGHTHLTTVEADYLSMSLARFSQILGDLFFFKATSVKISDPYLHILAYISGGIFGIPELLHVFAGLIYGAVYIRSLMLVKQAIARKYLTFGLFLLLAVFLMYRGVTGLNSIRWWTAFWFLFLGVAGYATTSKKKFIIIGFASVLVHFSFLALVIPAFLFYLLKAYPKLLFAIWALSFLFKLNYATVEPYVPDIDAITSREKITLDDEYIQEQSSKRSVSDGNFYATNGEIRFRDFSIPFLIIVLFLFRTKIRAEQIVFLAVFSAGLALYSFGNLFEFSPAVSGRSKAGASVFILASGVIFIANRLRSNSTNRKSLLLNLAVVVFFISCIPVLLFQLSYMLNMLSIFTVLFPIMSWLLGDLDPSIRDVIVDYFI